MTDKSISQSSPTPGRRSADARQYLIDLRRQPVEIRSDRPRVRAKCPARRPLDHSVEEFANGTGASWSGQQSRRGHRRCLLRHPSHGEHSQRRSGSGQDRSGSDPGCSGRQGQGARRPRNGPWRSRSTGRGEDSATAELQTVAHSRWALGPIASCTDCKARTAKRVIHCVRSDSMNRETQPSCTTTKLEL